MEARKSKTDLILIREHLDPKAESLLALMKWWEALGLEDKTRIQQLENGFPRATLEVAARLVGDLQAEARLDGHLLVSEQQVMQEPSVGARTAAGRLLSQFRMLCNDVVSRRRLEQMRVDAATLARVSNEVMNLHEVLSEVPRRRGGGFLAPRTSSGKGAKDDGRGYVCAYCKKGFAGRKNLSSHVRKYHETQSAFMCSYCGEVFGTRKYLRDHESKIHVEEAEEDGAKKEEEEKGETASAVLSGTAAANSPSPRHVCQECGRSFTRRCRLREHIDCVHERMRRKFSCSHRDHQEGGGTACGAAFSSRWLLKQHVSVVHWGERKYSCPACGRRFGYVHHVRSHLRHMHGGDGGVDDVLKVGRKEDSAQEQEARAACE